MRQHREILAQCRRIASIVSRMTATGLAGNYHARFKGQGLDFAQLRAYVQGDDPRAIDWLASTRSQRLTVREFREERRHRVFIILDLSSEMDFASIAQKKQNQAIIAMATIALTAIHQHDDVALLHVNTAQPSFVKAQSDPKQILRLVSESLTLLDADTRPKRSADTLSGLEKYLKKRSIVFVISDFWDLSFSKPLRKLTHRHDVIPVRVTDPFEWQLPDLGLITMGSPEQPQDIDTNNPENRRRYQQLAQNLASEWDRHFRGMGVVPLDLSTTDDPLVVMSHYFAMRRRRHA